MGANVPIGTNKVERRNLKLGLPIRKFGAARYYFDKTLILCSRFEFESFREKLIRPQARTMVVHDRYDHQLL